MPMFYVGSLQVPRPLFLADAVCPGHFTLLHSAELCFWKWPCLEHAHWPYFSDFNRKFSGYNEVHSTVFAVVLLNYEIRGRLYRGKCWLPRTSDLRIAPLPAQMSRFLSRIILNVILYGFVPSTLARLVTPIYV
jgi:hypothetical protein